MTGRALCVLGRGGHIEGHLDRDMKVYYEGRTYLFEDI
jgi:hypothetical protein